jgi:hypothetical protein
MPWTLWDALVDLLGLEVRAYIAEPDRGRRKWTGKRVEEAAIYAKRQRIADNRGKQLLRRRGALVERRSRTPTKLELRRQLCVHERQNEQKSLLQAACNLALLLRKTIGAGRREQRGTLWSICCFVLLQLIATMDALNRPAHPTPGCHLASNAASHRCTQQEPLSKKHVLDTGG